MSFTIKLHHTPSCVQISQNLLHRHLLNSFVDDVLNFLLALVQIQSQQLAQSRFCVHDEFHLKVSTKYFIISLRKLRGT